MAAGLFTTDPRRGVAQFDDLSVPEPLPLRGHGSQIAGLPRPDPPPRGRRVFPSFDSAAGITPGTGERRRQRYRAAGLSFRGGIDRGRAARARSRSSPRVSTSSDPRTAVARSGQPTGAHLLAAARSKLMRGMTLVELLVVVVLVGRTGHGRHPQLPQPRSAYPPGRGPHGAAGDYGSAGKVLPAPQHLCHAGGAVAGTPGRPGAGRHQRECTICVVDRRDHRVGLLGFGDGHGRATGRTTTARPSAPMRSGSAARPASSGSPSSACWN
ncbi:MAG: prepilin-type N-terminal cleavage/methylation domain-containing protein [Chromatiales bacterium]|nr:prepilin-type N-terminal cleavage/methylation domain-containing protein [Chromatiales bacterium]